MIKGLYETHLYVENLENSIEFYTKVLGLKQCRFGAERRTAFFWTGTDKQAMLGLWEKPKEEIDLRHFAFECDPEWIINESIDFKLSEHIFSKGFNLKLSENIHDKFGVNLKTQEDFTIINEFDDEFLWIGRGYPYRWITFHKTKNILFESPELSWVNLDSLFKGTIPDIVIGEWYKTSDFKEINGNKIRILRGLYEHKTSESGGPFFVYMFELHESNEVILISGFVNYPGHDKYLLLRQLEIIVKTALN